MTRRWINVEAMDRLERALNEFVSGHLSPTDLQAALFWVEQQTTSIEDQWVRSALSEAENALEEIAYTVSSNQRMEKMFSVVSNLRRQLWGG